MKVFHLELFCNRSVVLKKVLLIIIAFFYLFNLNAQIQSNVRLKIETGILWTSKSANPGLPWFNGVFLRVESKLKTSKNTFIGLRVGASINEKIENFDLPQFYSYYNPNHGLIQFTNPGNGIISIVPTFDYYFNDNNFRPYLGVGIGYYLLTNFTEISKNGIANSSEGVLEVSVNNRVGYLFRIGFDLGKFSVGLECNFIPKANVELPNGQIIGTVNNSYIGLSIGYSIGLRKILN